MNLEEQSIDKKYIPNVVTNNGQQYIYRIGKKPQHPTRHFMLFGIFTILIFIYGMQKVDGEVGLTQPDFTNSGGLTPQGFETNNSNGLTSSVTNWEQ